MEDNRPYWKVIVSLGFSVLATGLFLSFGVFAINFFMPFVIGWILSSIAYPLVCWVEKRLKIVKKIGSALIIVLVLALIVFLLYLGISKIVVEIIALVADSQNLYQQVEAGIKQIWNTAEETLEVLPPEIREAGEIAAANIGKSVSDFIGKLGQPTMVAAGNAAKSIPSLLVAIIITLVSAYFFTADRENIMAVTKKVVPGAIYRRGTMVAKNMKQALGGYFKAQFKIMGIVSILLLIGLLIQGTEYAIIFALLIAVLDFLPFFGTGTALGPWSVYALFMRDFRTAVILIVTYIVTQLVRQLIQPKLIGDNVGLNPFLTLGLLYVGFRMGGLLGMILAIPIGMITINMYKAGAFDYILDDVKILVKGILSLRKKE